MGGAAQRLDRGIEVAMLHFQLLEARLLVRLVRVIAGHIHALLGRPRFRYSQRLKRVVALFEAMADQRETPSGYDGLLTDIKQEEEMGMQQAHISALQTKHAGLDARIAEENQRPLPDMATLARLKKEKLRVKEALSGLA